MEDGKVAKTKHPQRRQRYAAPLCTWCAHVVHGDAVIVTFPDKAQATFHLVCLDQYRTTMWP